ncbi:MAG: hypothetical protein E7231_00275 [Cellulosilyticum sp.]|nr:hypothetical protein [Cellulosilyticum sp.]
MKNVNNLLDRLKGVQRDVATHIVTGVKHTRNHTRNFTVDELAKKFITDRSNIYMTFDKLAISEIIQISKPKTGVYQFRPLEPISFYEVAAVLEREKNEPM